MEIKPLSTDEEIREYLNKNYGGDYSAYRRDASNYDRPPIEKPAPLKKNAQEKLVESFEKIAKLRGISIEEYYRQSPTDYELVRQAGYSRSYQK